MNPQRELGNLFSVDDGCPYVQGGIGNISFVKDLLTDTVVNTNFKCSKFGPHIHDMLGWVITIKLIENIFDSIDIKIAIFLTTRFIGLLAFVKIAILL